MKIPRTFLLLLAFCLCSSCIAFTPLQSLKSFLTVVYVAQSDFDGFIGEDNEAGQALALEFSKEVELRRKQQQERRLLSEEELRFLNNKPFVKRRQVGGKESISSAGFFSGQGQTVYSFPLDVSPRSAEHDPIMVNGASPLLVPTMAVLVLLSVYLTFSSVAAPKVEDWNTVKNVVPVEQVMPPSVYL